MLAHYTHTHTQVGNKSRNENVCGNGGNTLRLRLICKIWINFVRPIGCCYCCCLAADGMRTHQCTRFVNNLPSVHCGRTFCRLVHAGMLRTEAKNKRANWRMGENDAFNKICMFGWPNNNCWRKTLRICIKSYSVAVSLSSSFSVRILVSLKQKCTSFSDRNPLARIR